MRTEYQIRRDLEITEQWIDDDKFMPFLKDIHNKLRSIELKELIKVQLKEFNRN